MAARQAVVAALKAGPKPWRVTFDVSKPELQPFKGRSVISAEQFNRENILYVLAVANIIHAQMQTRDRIPLLEGKTLGNLFLEPSTRTMTSFHSAMLRLGGNVLSVSESTSSVQKGETLEDTIRTLENYADVIALRHPVPGAADLAASSARRAPIINAGDGGNEHPSQALLDLFCIDQEVCNIEEPFTLTLLGDLKFGRTVHSLSQMVSHFPNITLNLVSPPNLRMPDEILAQLKQSGCRITEREDLEPVLGQTDVLYHTRVQKERFSDLKEYEASKGRYIINPQIMAKCKKTMKLMHPFPRVDEITEDVDNDPRALYFKQPKYGLHLRMALLTLALGGEINLPRHFIYKDHRASCDYFRN